MIDEDWLREVRGRTPQGFNVTGLLGVGAEAVVFKVQDKEGNSFALKTSRATLAYHIQELSLALSCDRKYSVATVNEKLYKLVGNKSYHRMVLWYHKVHVRYLRIIQKVGVRGSLFSTNSIQSIEYLPFFLKSPGMIERLTELVEWPDDDLESALIFMPEDPAGGGLQDTVFSARRWAAEAIRDISQLSDRAAPYVPDRLYNNPLIIWGGAIISDFFVDDELEQVATFIRDRFGWLPNREDVFEFQGQFFCVADMLAEQFEGELDVELARWLRLAGLCGIRGQITDRSGRVVASSFP